MKLLIFEVLCQGWALILLAFVRDDSDRRGPLLELIDPILDGHERHDHKVRSLVAFVADQV